MEENNEDIELYIKRRDAAEEVCWTIILMMHLGMLDIPDEERALLAETMQKWSDLAAECGILGDNGQQVEAKKE